MNVYVQSAGGGGGFAHFMGGMSFCMYSTQGMVWYPSIWVDGPEAGSAGRLAGCPPKAVMREYARQNWRAMS